MIQVVTFHLREQMYGMDIRLIKEVNPTVDVTVMPRSARHVRGLVNIRGQVVLILDMAAILEQEPADIGPDSHIIILKTVQDSQNVGNIEAVLEQIRRFGDKPIGFLVDRIGDVLSVEDDCIEAPPQHLSRLKIGYFRGIVKQKDQPLILLNAGEMIH